MHAAAVILALLLQDAAPDVGAALEHFPSPIPALYGEGWDKVVKVGGDAIAYSGKQVTYDLQLYRGRIYIGHGSTNTKQKTHMLYFDPLRGAFDVDRDAGGKPLAFPEECMARLRVFDDELYVSSTDQLDGGTKFFRKNRDGTWTIRTAHKQQQHSRDLFKVGPHILVHFGMGNEGFPGMVYSPDDGRSWTVLSQLSLYDGPYIGYSTFFGFKDVCYATRPAGAWVPLGGGEWGESRQPWILAFSGDPARPFRSVCATPADFHPEILHGTPPKPDPARRAAYDGPSPAQLSGGIAVGGRLLLANQGVQLFAVESLEPMKARRLDLPGCPLGGEDGWRIADMLERPDAGHLLLVRREGRETVHARVLKSTDGLSWTALFGFSGPHRPLFLEELDGDFYFGLFKSELLRVRKAAYAGP